MTAPRKKCLKCGRSVWLTKRGKLMQHIDEEDVHAAGFAMLSSGVDSDIERCAGKPT